MKICNVCRVEKNENQFPKRCDRKSGLWGTCSDCKNRKRREKYSINPEKYLSQSKKNYLLHREEIVKKNIEYARRHHESVCERHRKWWKKNKEDQLLKRKKRRINKEWWKKFRSTEDYKKKNAARQKLHSELKKGLMVRAKNCEICNAEGKIQGHHADYENPYEVIWVCTQCHANIDRHKLKRRK